MLKRSQTRVILLIVATLIVGSVGFWLGRATDHHPATPAVVAPASQDPTTGPHDLVASLRESQADQSRKAGELLAWYESLRQAPERMTDDDGRLVFQAIQLFGELRYTPAIPLLVSEAFKDQRKIGFLPPNWRPGETEPRPWVFEEMEPHITALIQIGPPAASPLVQAYVKYWKMGPEKRPYLTHLEPVLGRESLLGAALGHIQKELMKSNSGGIDRDERDALHRLKRELLKGID